ncbi:MAG: glycerophosphodiester phosphodiesterase [bacterium]|nr:glycerophosphodiester phosphodiesterase [bacterium]
MKKSLLFTGCALLLLLSTVLFVELSFSRIEVAPFYDSCLKVWGHKGYTSSHEKNSLESFQHAFEIGAAGVEFDIRYDTALDDSFIVSHNFPYALKSGKLLTLEEVLGKLGDKGYFWLDIKNLRELSGNDTVKAADRMLDLLEKYRLSDRIIVESKIARKLAIFADRKIFTSLWITPGRNDGWLDSRLKMLLYKIRFLRGGFSAFSMNYVNFSPYVQNSLGHVPVHLFTINDLDEIREYMPITNVKIILSDENFFSLDSCDE